MIEEKVLKKIECLKRAYKEKEDEFWTEQIKLEEYVKKHLAENSIQNDDERLREVVGILPDSRIRDSLISHLYDLESKEKEQQPVQEGEQGAATTESGRKAGRASSCGDACHSGERVSEKSTLKGIECQAQTYQKKEKAFKAEQKKLHEFVEGYLDENGIKKDIKKLDEVIGVLPGGILRFRLLECKYGLMEKMEGQQCVSGKDMETQGELDAQQASCGTQATGMGGIQ